MQPIFTSPKEEYEVDFDDYRWLVGDDAERYLDHLAQDKGPLLQRAGRLRRQLSATRTHLLLELVELRRRAAEKFPAADKMFFTRKGLEQATDYWVATHKAPRLARPPCVADLACGIGGDLQALAAHAPAVGVDRDPASAYFAAANLERLGSSPARPSTVCLADVRHLPLTEFGAWHLDPDRRAGKTRTRQVAFSEPPLETIDDLLARWPHAAIKLAPAADLPLHWRDQAEWEWIGRDGQCRQLVAWFGDLASRPAARRATLLTSESPGEVRLVREVAGTPTADSLPLAPAVERYVFDPDATILAAGLLPTLAGDRPLRLISRQAAYLTSETLVVDPALAAFEVLEVLPLDLRRLRQVVRTRGLALLEVKKRGVPHDPEQIRRQLKTNGGHRGVLILTPQGPHQIAILAKRLEPPRQPPPAGRPIAAGPPSPSVHNSGYLV